MVIRIIKIIVMPAGIKHKHCIVVNKFQFTTIQCLITCLNFVAMFIPQPLILCIVLLSSKTKKENFLRFLSTSSPLSLSACCYNYYNKLFCMSSCSADERTPHAKCAESIGSRE